jgi:hypothetical protein
MPRKVIERVRLQPEKAKTENAPNKKRGRPPGIPNKHTAMLRDAILMAAEIVGQDGRGKDGLLGYLTTCAMRYPKQYLSVMARVLPYQVTVQKTVEISDARERVQTKLESLTKRIEGRVASVSDEGTESVVLAGFERGRGGGDRVRLELLGTSKATSAER